MFCFVDMLNAESRCAHPTTDSLDPKAMKRDDLQPQTDCVGYQTLRSSLQPNQFHVGEHLQTESQVFEPTCSQPSGTAFPNKDQSIGRARLSGKPWETLPCPSRSHYETEGHAVLSDTSGWLPPPCSCAASSDISPSARRCWGDQHLRSSCSFWGEWSWTLQATARCPTL